LPIGSDRPVVEMRGVSKRFQVQDSYSLKEFLPSFLVGRGWRPPFFALRDVNLSVGPGETLGIIGRNGSGKSTILKLVAGVMEPTEGEVEVEGRVCPLIELGSGFHPDLTGRENILLNGALLGLSPREIGERYPAIVDFAEMGAFMETPVKRYSSGMYVRLAFSVAVHCDPDILLVDEALAVGDEHFREKSLGRMEEVKRQGVTIMFVSHQLDLVETFCTRALLLQGGRVARDAAPADAVRHYRQQLAMETASAAHSR
jgi:ABC-2 type transport system ATP-binding protein